MKAARFDYIRAESVEHALECISDGEAKPIAGGQSLLPMMNFRVARPERLIDIDGLTALDRIVEDVDGRLLIGGLVRHSRLVRDALIRSHVPLLAAAAQHIGHVAIRNRGTLGGSLAHADPTAELPAACLALDAQFVCDRADGRRRVIAASDFFHGRYMTALEDDELLTWVSIAGPGMSPIRGWGFAEVAPREGDFAWAGACVLVRDETTRCVVFGLEVAARVLDLRKPRAEKGDLEEFINGLHPSEEPEFRKDLGLSMLRRATTQAEAMAIVGPRGGHDG